MVWPIKAELAPFSEHTRGQAAASQCTAGSGGGSTGEIEENEQSGAASVCEPMCSDIRTSKALSFDYADYAHNAAADGFCSGQSDPGQAGRYRRAHGKSAVCS